MSNSSRLRAAAARCLQSVRGGRSLDRAIAEFAPGTQAAFFKALVYESVRWQPRLAIVEQTLLSKSLSRKDQIVSSLLQVALCELTVMDRASHAAVSESVNAVRDLDRPRLAGLVNGVLRRFLREREGIERRVAKVRVAKDAHPAWWRDRFDADWHDKADQIIAAGNRKAPLWLRVNGMTDSVDAYAAELAQAGIGTRRSTFAEHALCLEQPRSVDDLPGFAEGRVSVQDAAAQLAAPLLRVESGHRVLDACAAPGGKTAHLLELTDGNLDLLALDQDAERLAKVADNLDRLSLEAQLVAADARDSASWWDGRRFDRILIDAPCTGSGVIRRHPDIKLLRRPGDTDRLATVQRELLQHLWPMLEPGGILLYCSCSVFQNENQRQIKDFLSGCQDAELLPLSDSLSDSFGGRRGPGMQILPGEDDMDGFFYAALLKSGSAY